MQKRHNSIAYTLELHLLCIKPSKYFRNSEDAFCFTMALITAVIQTATNEAPVSNWGQNSHRLSWSGYKWLDAMETRSKAGKRITTKYILLQPDQNQLEKIK